VDSALDRLEEGSFGICEVCHDAVEIDRLVADPLVRICLDHLPPSERAALEEDLETASRIQAALLPRKESRHGNWEIAYHYAPLRTVSGDYCDLFPGAEDRELALLVGDVSGKGVGASLLMAHLHATFRALLGAGIPLSATFEQANRLFTASSPPSHFATVAAARFAGDEVEICNAGHCPPLVAHKGEVVAVPPGGLPLGMFGDGRYELYRTRFEPGDNLILVSDGLLEARRGEEEFGIERLCELAGRLHTRSAPELLDQVLDSLDSFREGGPIEDDLTVLVARRV
jgi:phosphoserine phosphatase RsbU/P